MVHEFAHLVEDDEFYHDEAAALRVVEFVETFAKLDKTHRGKPFKLEPWQRQIVWDVFGWRRRDNDERRFTSAYIEVPRKNGKTYFVAALALFLLMADGVEGAEVYASARTNEQSRILYKSVLSMIDQDEFLGDRLEVARHKSEVRYPKRNGVLKALSGEATGSHGKYPSAVICDELHEWEGERAEFLYEALTSGFGNRRSPLVIHITTAGFGSAQTECKKLHEKALQFAAGKCGDSNFYGVVYGADLKDDWTSEATWKKANPSYALAENNLKRELKTALSDPSKENTFRRLYLNQWTQQQTRWLDLADWKEATNSRLRYEDYKGKPCVLGLDLGSVYDLTALSILYPEKDAWKLFVRCFMPSKQIERRSKEDAIPYDEWAKRGWIIPTLGDSQGVSADYAAILEEVRKVSRENPVICLGFDPGAGAQLVIPTLDNVDGLDTLTVNQTFREMGPAAAEFERRLSSRLLVVEDNPCLSWQAGNVEVVHDAKSPAYRPTKPNSKGGFAGTQKYKVDGIVASVIATQTALLKCAAAAPEKPKAKPTVLFVRR